MLKSFILWHSDITFIQCVTNRYFSVYFLRTLGIHFLVSCDTFIQSDVYNKQIEKLHYSG